MLGHVGSRWITLEVAGLQERDVCMQPQVQHQKTNRKKLHHLAIALQSVDSGIGSTCWFNQLTKCWIRIAPTDTSVRKTNLNLNIFMFAAGSIAWRQLGPTWKQHAKLKSASTQQCCFCWWNNSNSACPCKQVPYSESNLTTFSCQWK